MEGWVITLIGGLFGGGGLAGVLTFFATRKKDKATEIGDRFDDASALAKYIREEVERQVEPIRRELATVKAESHEIQDTFRTWIVGVWKWNQRGRHGDIPMPPRPILTRLGLSHFADDWPTEPSRPTSE